MLGEEQLVIFKFSNPFFATLRNVKRNATLWKKGIEVATFLPIAAGQFCLPPFG
jgi:hypothetical protein